MNNSIYTVENNNVANNNVANTSNQSLSISGLAKLVRLESVYLPKLSAKKLQQYDTLTEVEQLNYLISKDKRTNARFSSINVDQENDTKVVFENARPELTYQISEYFSPMVA